MRRIKRLPTPAMVVAVVALILALTGSAVAAKTLTAKKFKNQAVRGPVTYVTTTALVNNQNVPGTPPGQNITAACPGGFFPTGGGVKSAAPSNLTRLFVQYFYPSAPNGFTANVFAGLAAPPPTGTAESVSVIAACVKSKKSSGALPAVSL